MPTFESMLKPRTYAALRAWLLPSSWYTTHASDEGRFYEFLDAYEREHGTTIDEPTFRQEAEQILGGRRTDALDRILDERISFAVNFLACLEHTHRSTRSMLHLES